MTDDLVAFLLARLDEDEQTAREAAGGRWAIAPHYDDPTTRNGIAPTPDRFDILGIDGPEVGHVWSADRAAHIARHDPTRVLREVTAKRAVLGQYESATATLRNAEGTVRDLMDGAVNTYRHVLTALALPYADHPDYQEEWRP